MTTDTIMVRIDIGAVGEIVDARTDLGNRDRNELMERLVSALQRQIENEIREFEAGNGCFESCFYDAL